MDFINPTTQYFIKLLQFKKKTFRSENYVEYNTMFNDRRSIIGTSPSCIEID